MIKLFLAGCLIAISSTCFADGECDTNLSLSCEIRYVSQGEVIEKSTRNVNFSYENEDEPSLWKCSTSAYFDDQKTPHTSVRIYVVKDFNSKSVVASAQATQVGPFVQRYSVLTNRYYSNTSEGTSSVGQAIDLGNLMLPLPIVINQKTITEISLNCVVE